jgi:predicted molibdopterin-dependent oxidoreductase YjgC
VEWRVAIAGAAERLRQVLAAGGAVGVLGSGRATNEENFLAVRLARAGLRTNHVDSCLRAQYQALVTGLRATNSGSHLGSAIADIERSDVVVLLEGDLAHTHPRAAFAVMRAVRRGARLITMGPTRTQMSRLAWLHLPLLPGDEPVLAARLAVVAEGGRPSSGARQGPVGGVSNGAPRIHHHLMASAELRRAVEAYASAEKAAVILAPTGAAAPSLHALARAFAKLASTTGQLRRVGSVLLPLAVRSNTCGALEMGAAPNCLPGLCALDDEPARRRLRQVWGSDVAWRHGLDAEAMTREVKGLVVLADEPSAVLRGGAVYRSSLAKLDCLITLDAFVTPTVQASHVALPIASPAESDGTYTNMEGRVQWLRPAASPPGEARPGWWVLSELAAAVGMERTYGTIAEVRRDLIAAVPSYPDAMSRDEKATSGSDMIRRIVTDGAARTAESDFAGEPPNEGVRLSPTQASQYPFRLATAGVIDWGADPLVGASPTLCRDHRSLRKLFRDGLVEMSSHDAAQLGIRQGWRVRLTSVHGEALVPVNLRDDLEPGILLVPFAFRDQVEPVLRQEALTEVNVERA